MPRPTTQSPKIRINIMIHPDLLKRIDDVTGQYERSGFIGEACKEKLARESAQK